MATMSMNKAIHGAVRRDLRRFVEALGSFPPGDASRAAGLRRAWDNFDHQLVRHHTGEHEIAWPHLESLGLGHDLLAEMDAEHGVMAEALATARGAVHALGDRPSAESASSALVAVKELQRVTEDHLDHEEGEIEEFYLRHEHTPEMKAMGKEFSRDGGAKEGGAFFAWMLDGATPTEREAITHSIPGPVLAILTGVFGRRYRKEVAPVWSA